jgi:hypothetical protein
MAGANKRRNLVLRCHYMFLFPVESRLIIHEAFDSSFSAAVDSPEFFKGYRSARRS